MESRIQQRVYKNIIKILIFDKFIRLTRIINRETARSQMYKSANYYMGTQFRKSKYPHGFQKDPRKMIDFRTRQQEKYFYLQIEAQNIKNIQRSQDQIHGEEAICIIAKNKQESVIIQNQLERHFQHKSPDQNKSNVGARIHAAQKKVQLKRNSTYHLKKLSMYTQNSVENQWETPYVKRKKMSERQVKTEDIDYLNQKDNKNSSQSVSSKKKKIKVNRLEFKDIAIVKRLLPHQESAQKPDIDNITVQIPISKTQGNQCFTKYREQDYQNKEQNQNNVKTSLQIKKSRFGKKSKHQNDGPIFNSMKIAEMSLSKSAYESSKKKLPTEEHHEKKSSQIFFFPKNYGHNQKYYSSQNQRKNSSSQNQRTKSYKKRKTIIQQDKKIVIPSQGRSHSNAGYRNIINSPSKSHQRQKKQKYFNFDGTLENYKILPQYNYIHSPHNRPHTAKILGKGRNSNKDIQTYSKIARKCESANKSKKINSTNMSNLRPWGYNDGPSEEHKNILDLSFSSIHDYGF